MNLDETVARLVENGAAFTNGPAGYPFVVGLMRRIGPKRWFWWEAGAETEFGAHEFSGDHKILYDGLAITWTDGDRLSYLTTIALGYEEPDDITYAKKVWLDWKTEYESNARLRRFIEQIFLERVRDSKA